MSSEKVNTAEVFIYFLNNLIECQNIFFKENKSKAYLILDNAPIHKTADVKVYVEQ